MIRLYSSILVSAVLAAMLAPAARGAGAPGPRLWSQYEIARALTSEGIRVDEAARLAARRDFTGALHALGQSDDSLRTGMLACKAGRYASAIDLLGGHSGNAHLEVFRRFLRAKALYEERRYGEAAFELDRLSALETTGLIAPPPSLARDVRHLSGELVASCDSLFAAKGVPHGEDSLSERSLLLFSRRFVEAGEDSAAVALFARAAGKGSDPADAPLFFELFERMKPLLNALGRGELLQVAARAVSWKRYDEADHVADCLVARDAEDPEAALLKATVTAGRGSARTALTLFDRIAASRAPRSIREQAMVRAASLEYGLGRYAKAAARYHRLATRFPSNRRSMGWLDLAARIEVMRGDYGKAIAYWGDAKRVAGSNRAAAVSPAISRAALTVRLGDRDKAHEILLGALAAAPAPTEPRLLYWLFRTSPSDSARSRWEQKLEASSSRSVYAMGLRRDIDSLITERMAETSASGLEGIARAEWSLLDSLGARTSGGDSLFVEPAVQAYLYLVDCGFIGEASELGRTLEKRLSGDGSALAALCRSVLLRGRYDLSVLLSRDWRGSEVHGRLRSRLQHPIAYAALVARESAAAKVPPELVLAVMREESRFDPCALSRSRAEGLMQLMPATARWIARKYETTQGFSEDLCDPEFNVAVGCRYLEELLGRFNGSLVGALAAYNAGERKMAKWKERFDPASDPFIALEMIGPAETRGYVARVLESMFVYRAMVSEGRD